MQSRWNESEAQQIGDDPLALRVYTSRLLGQDPALVLHGGGNTSVKATAVNLFGETEEILYVKGSGWDLATIQAEGFAPVRLDVLRRVAELEQISDTVLVKTQRAAMIDPSAPDPSIEAVLHAIIPFKVVDHTHADAVVALTNTPEGKDLVEEVYGDRVLVVPYVMPGFVLARKVYEMTRRVDWSRYEGMILLNHGIFTWGETAREAYEQMIRLVSMAEDHLAGRGALNTAASEQCAESLLDLSRIRRLVSQRAGRPMLAHLIATPEACGFSSLPNVAQIATRGPLTPDHILRTKQVPVILDGDPAAALERFAGDYRAYFERSKARFPGLTMLDTAPRWAVWPGHGVLTFGGSAKEANIVADIVEHTIQAIQWAEKLGGWRALPEADLFEVEYWELEQAKLKKGGKRPPLEGKVALITGAASGIGRACLEELASQGAAVAGLDINPAIADQRRDPHTYGIPCDVTDFDALHSAVDAAVRRFGGLDIVIANAGIFPPSARIEQTDPSLWDRTLAINLTSQQRLMQFATAYLKNGIDPAIVIIGSKNVPAPGPGQSAYSVSKAGLTQLARVAALELGEHGIRVNIIHPNQVFDTGAWTPEVIESRAQSYGITPEEYRTSNLLRTEVAARDVAVMAAAMAGPVFGKTTGAQVPVDGGNDRVV